VVGRSQLVRHVERIDEHKPVARLDRKRRDFVLPFLVPRRPAAQSWR
jgi:hypothetical protein